jgi:D-arabinose 1-dehydrogenase-like Zn-dependent alcohol dehydrogenase
MGGKPCLECWSCVAGLIEDVRVLGIQHDGAWAEYIAVPWFTVAPVPEGVPMEQAAIACDAVATPFAALTRRGALRPGERVGIWGIGGLGTHAVQIARLAGAPSSPPWIHCRRRGSGRSRSARTWPSTRRPTTCRGAIRDATGGRGLNLALDAVGRSSVVRQAMFSMVRGGRIVLMGQSFETLDAGPILVVSFLRIALLGHLGYGKQDLIDVLELVASGRLDLSGSISDRLPLARINDGIRRLTSKDDATARLVVLPQA